MANILVIEDMAGVRRSISVVMSAMGHDVTEAENGRIGLDILKTNDNIDLVVTDILMPEADGIEVLVEINKMEIKPKVLVISGGGNLLSQDEALQMAQSFADIILRKPFSREDVIKAVEELTA